jgi:hypothetical protein
MTLARWLFAILEGSAQPQSTHASGLGLSTHAQGPTVLQRSYRGEIDFIGVFCPQTGEVYMVPESEIVDSTMHLRVAPTINRQDRHIRWAHRFKLA